MRKKKSEVVVTKKNIKILYGITNPVIKYKCKMKGNIKKYRLLKTLVNLFCEG